MVSGPWWSSQENLFKGALLKNTRRGFNPQLDSLDLWVSSYHQKICRTSGGKKKRKMNQEKMSAVSGLLKLNEPTEDHPREARGCRTLRSPQSCEISSQRGNPASENTRRGRTPTDQPQWSQRRVSQAGAGGVGYISPGKDWEWRRASNAANSATVSRPPSLLQSKAHRGTRGYSHNRLKLGNRTRKEDAEAIRQGKR